MNPGFVADSSVAIAWVVHSQSSQASERLLDEVETGTPFLVPVLWMFEVANSLLLLERRRRIDKQEYEQARLDLTDLNPLVDDEGQRLALGEISAIAEKYGLTVDDATYLELAFRRGLSIATRDTALNKAAKRAGVRTLL